METNNPSEIRLQDPLSNVTRKERRNLLVVASIGLIMLKASILPSKISTLGVEFTSTDQSAFLKFTALITVYYLVTFLFYAGSDYVAWRMQYYKALNDAFVKKAESAIIETMEYHDPKAISSFNKWSKSTIPISVMRTVLEFIFPIIYGVYVINYLFIS